MKDLIICGMLILVYLLGQAGGRRTVRLKVKNLIVRRMHQYRSGNNLSVLEHPVDTLTSILTEVTKL